MAIYNKMKVYNTLTGKKEEFTPREPNKVSIYVCGPTVYNYIHIGNARAYVSFDTIIRYLKYKGFEIEYVRNLTDVDDKIIKRAAEENTTTEAITKKYTEAFHKDMQTLGVEKPTIEPKATEHINEMIGTIKQLIEHNLAYEIDGDVYFSVRNFKNYGKLSKRSLDDMIAGARVEIDERKKNPADFALWKKAKEGEPSWSSPWGNGRPGWHIECSTMSTKYLGMGFDIHGGGQDLIFPHHENEIAQAEGATGKKPFARYWLHNGFLNIEAEKMAKSVGNVILIKDLEEQYKDNIKDLRNDLRMLFLLTHYHSPLNFSQRKLEEAKSATKNIIQIIERLNFLVDKADSQTDGTKLNLAPRLQKAKVDFDEAMNDDFNTAVALSAIFNLATDVNTILDQKPEIGKASIVELKETSDVFNKLMNTLGFEITKTEISQSFNDLLKQREEARKNKDFAVADKIRDQLLNEGYVIEDTPYGPKLKKT